MDTFSWDTFINRYKIFAYIFVYIGYFFHLVNLFKNSEILLYAIIGYLVAISIMHIAFFNPVIIILHSSIFFSYLNVFYPFIEGKIISIIFFVPFYSTILYSIFSMFGLEDMIEKKIKNARLKKTELEKKLKQSEWDSLPDEEKNTILLEKKKNEDEQKRKNEQEHIKKENEYREGLKKQEEERKKQLELEKIKLKHERLKQIELIKENEKQKTNQEDQKRIQEEIKLQKQREEIERKEREHKEDIKRKILENERKKKLEAEAIQELIDEGLIDNNHYTGKNIRESISTEVKIAVWNRDKQCCVNCSSTVNLEFDHIIPISKGGANTVNNLQLLCISCNRKKSNKII